jgi:DNA-binding transcriptional LysR family regulator
MAMPPIVVVADLFARRGDDRVRSEQSLLLLMAAMCAIDRLHLRQRRYPKLYESGPGVRLLARTTRSLLLTDEGRAFHERCERIVGELAEAGDSIAQARGEPSGRLRVEAPVAFGRRVVAPRLAPFLARYPSVRIELILRDQRVDPVAEEVDVLVRIGPLRNSPLMARRLGESRAILCASPEYVSRLGKPRRAADLARHACLTYLRDGRIHVFDPDGRAAAPAGPAPFAANDEDVIRQMVLASHGIAWLFEFLVADDLQTGALVQLLDDQSTPTWPIHALYPKNRHLLPKARAFIDFFVKSLNGEGR